MNPEIIENDTQQDEDSLQRYDINRGLLDGCAVYLSNRDRFPVRTGTFDREIHTKFTQFGRNARVFLDIGAAEGFYSVYMLKNTEAKVFAYEASEEASGSLLRNLEENTRNGHRLWYDDREIRNEKTDRDTTTIDCIAGHESGPVFLKIDVDGSELEVLRGAGRVLDREDTRLIVRSSSKHSEQECMRLLDEHGFDVSIVGPAWWRSIIRDRNSDEQARWIIAEKRQIEGLFS
ncbi:MAG: hypothetical protein HKN23_03940 [Verrucomicrobiales bacterium]|nr:hypothetical protein [Verrucomicrobiales bacterium]